MAAIPILNKSIQKTKEWIHEIQEITGWEDESCALAVLRATLHELRDNLLINDLAHFSAQLPVIIRGLLFEQWNPDHSPRRDRKKIDFLEGVASGLPSVCQDIDIEEAVRAIFQTISRKIDNHEIEKLKKILPHHIRELMTCTSKNLI